MAQAVRVLTESEELARESSQASQDSAPSLADPLRARHAEKTWRPDGA